jgi:hypothetical protein
MRKRSTRPDPDRKAGRAWHIADKLNIRIIHRVLIQITENAVDEL